MKRSFIPAILVLGAALMFWAYVRNADDGAGAFGSGMAWKPVPEGLVLTRNFMVPRMATWNGYRLLDERYRLGSKAYSREAPGWWLELAKKVGIDEQSNPGDFPLVYAGEFKAKDGIPLLLVVQVSHSFSGDGSYGPGPVLHLVARLLASGTGGPKVVAEESVSLGSFQYWCLYAGELKGGQVVFRAEGGNHYDSRKVTARVDLILNVGEDLSLKFWEAAVPR